MKLSHTQNKLKIHHDDHVLSEQTSVTQIQEEDYRRDYIQSPTKQTVEIERKNSVKSVSKQSDVKIITQQNNVTKIIEKTSKVSTSVFQQSVTSSAKQELHHQARNANQYDIGLINQNAGKKVHKHSKNNRSEEDQSEVLTDYVNADYGIEQTGPDQIITVPSQKHSDAPQKSFNGVFQKSRHSVDQNPTISEQQSVFGHIQQNGAKDYQVQSAYHLNTRKSVNTTLDHEIEPVKTKNLSIKHVQFSSKSPGSVFKGGDNISQGTGYTAQYNPIQGSIPDYGVERRTTTAQANGDRKSMKMQLLRSKDGYSSSGLTTMTQNQKVKHRFSHSLDQKTEASNRNQQYAHGYGFKEKDSTHDSQRMQSSKSVSAQLKGVSIQHEGVRANEKVQQTIAPIINIKSNQSKLPQVMKVHVVKPQKAKKEQKQHNYISLPKQTPKPVLPQIDQSNNEYITSSQVQEFSSENQASSAQNYVIPFVAEIVIPNKVQGKMQKAELRKPLSKQKPPTIQDIHHMARISKQIDNDNIMTKSSIQTHKMLSKNDPGYRCDSSNQVLDSESARFKSAQSHLLQSGHSSADPQNFKVVCRNIREQLDSMVQTMDDIQNQNQESALQPQFTSHEPEVVAKNQKREMTNIISTTENDGEVTMQGDTSRFQSEQVDTKVQQQDDIEPNSHKDHTTRYEEMLNKGKLPYAKVDAQLVSDPSSYGVQHLENHEKGQIIHEAREINVRSTNEIDQKDTYQRLATETKVEPVRLPSLNIEKSVMKLSPISLKKQKLEAELVDKSMQVTQDGERTLEFACQTSEIVQEQPEYNLTSTKMPLFNITANVDSEHNHARKLTDQQQAGSDIFNIQSVKQDSVIQKYSSKELIGPNFAKNAGRKNKNARAGPVKNLFDKSSQQQASQSNDIGDVSRDITAVSNHQRQRTTIEQQLSPDSKHRSTTSELYTADAFYQSRNQHRPTVQELKKHKIIVNRNRGASQQQSQWLAEDSVFGKSKKAPQQTKGRKQVASFVFGHKKSMQQSYYTSAGHGRQRSLQQSSNTSEHYLHNDYEATPPLNPFTGKKSRMVKRVRNSVHADARDPGGQYNLYPGKPLHSRKRDRFYGSLDQRPLLLEPSVQVHASRFAESYSRLKGQEQAIASRQSDGRGRLKDLLYVPGARGSAERPVVQNQFHQQIFDGEINAVNINIQQNNTLDNEFTMGSVSNPNLTGVTDKQRIPEITMNTDTFKGMPFETNQKNKKAVNARTQTRGSAEPNMNLMENFEIQQVRSDGGTHLNGVKTGQNTTQRKKANDDIRQSDFTCARKQSYEDKKSNQELNNKVDAASKFETVPNQLNQVKEETSRNLVSHTRTLSKQSLNHSKQDNSDDEHDQALEMVDRIQKEQQKQEQIKKQVEESYKNLSKRIPKNSKLDSSSIRTEATKKIEFDKAITTDSKNKRNAYGYCPKISPVVPQTTISEKVMNKPSIIKPSTPIIMEVTQTHDGFDPSHDIVPKIEVQHTDKSTSIQLRYNLNSPPEDTPAAAKSPKASKNDKASSKQEKVIKKSNSKTQTKIYTKRTFPTSNNLKTDQNTSTVINKDEPNIKYQLDSKNDVDKSKQYLQVKSSRREKEDQYESTETYYIDIPQKKEQVYRPDSSLDLEERNLVQQRVKVMSEKDRILYELKKLEQVKKKVENEKVQQHKEIIQQEKERLNQEYLELNHLKDLLTIRKQELDDLKDLEVHPLYDSDDQQESQYTYTWRSYSSYEDDVPDQGGQATKPTELSIKNTNLVVPRIMIPEGSGKQQSTTKNKEQDGRISQRVDVFQGLFDWAQSIIMTDLRNQQQKFLVRDKNGQPSKKLLSENDVYTFQEQFRSKSVKEEDLPLIHKTVLRTMIELMKQLNQPEDVIEEMQQDITEQNTFALIKKCSSLLMARSYVYKTLRNLLWFEKLVHQIRNEVEAYIECGTVNDAPKQQEIHRSLMKKCVGDKSSQQIETNLTMISIQIIQDIAYMRDNFRLFEHMTAYSSKGHHVKNVMAYRRRDAMRYVAKKYQKIKKLVELIAKESGRTHLTAMAR